MIVLGIDPGISCTGYGVLEKKNGRIYLIEFGVVKTTAKDPMAKRLQTLYDGICEVIASLHPHEFAIETVFVGKNIQSALKLGHARGVAILAAGTAGLNVSEYAPREIKQSITGTGSASKEQVQYMVKSILNLKQIPKPNDAADAVAIALSHLQRINFRNKLRINR